MLNNQNFLVIKHLVDSTSYFQAIHLKTKLTMEQTGQGKKKKRVLLNTCATPDSMEGRSVTRSRDPELKVPKHLSQKYRIPAL